MEIYNIHVCSQSFCIVIDLVGCVHANMMWACFRSTWSINKYACVQLMRLVALVAQYIEARLYVYDSMEPLAGHETRSVKSENGKLFAQVCPPHRPSSTDSDWYSVSPGEIDPSTVAVTDFLLQIQESAVAKNQEQSTGNSILTNEKPSPPVEQAKIPSLDVVTGRPKVRRVCHICGRECPSRHKLQRHLSTHTEERPYSCKICGKAFKWTEYLSKHMRTQHHDDNSNPSMYVCMQQYMCMY